MIPGAVGLSHGMDVVSYGVGVGDLKRLIDLYAKDTRMEPASLLVDDNVVRGYGEVFPLEALADVDEGIGEVTVIDRKRFVVGLTLVGFDAGGIFAYVDSFTRGNLSQIVHGACDGACCGRVHLEQGGCYGLLDYRLVSGLVCLTGAAGSQKSRCGADLIESCGGLRT